MTAVTISERSVTPSDVAPFLLLKRPCLLLVAFLIPGIVVGHRFFPGGPPPWLLLPAATSLAVAALLLFVHSTFSTAASMLVVFWVGVLLGGRCDMLPPDHAHFQLEPRNSYSLRGIVVAEPVAVHRPPWWRSATRDRFRFTLEAKEFREAQSEKSGWDQLRGKILVYTSAIAHDQLEYGDEFELTGETFLADARRNPGGFHYRRYLAENGVHLCMRAVEIHKLARGKANPVSQFLHSLKKKIRHSFSAGSIDEKKQSFLRAIILGERREVGEEFLEALRRTNTMHILAISGLHVGAVVLGTFFFLSEFVHISRRLSSAIALVLLFTYVPLTGMRPPIVRASIMCTAFLMAPLLRRKSDSVNSLALAAVVILLFRPAELFRAGFQLSFMVVLSILLFADKFWKLFATLFRLRPDPGFLTIGRVRRGVYSFLDKYLLRFFSISLSAFLGFVPLGLYYFHRISLLSPLCNVLTLSLVGCIVPLGFLAGIIGLVSQGVAGLVNSMNGPLIAALQHVVSTFSGISLGAFNIAPPSVAFCITFYVLLSSIGFGRTFRSFRKLLVPKIVVAVATVVLLVGGELARCHPDAIEITFLDVGQGDCAYVEFPDGGKMLVDGGSINKNDVGRYVIVPFLRWAGVNKLDAIVVTHYDADHINGLEGVVEEIGTRMVIRRATPDPPGTLGAVSLLQAIEESRKTRVKTVGIGDRFPVPSMFEVDVLHPAKDSDRSDTSENNLSIVLKFDFRGTSVLLCGDIEKQAELEILRRVPSLQGDVIKVPHHGSKSSSSGTFVRHVAPRIAIISCGRRNIYGHPSPEVLRRYEELGVRVFRTDRDGGIVVRIYAERLRITTTL